MIVNLFIFFLNSYEYCQRSCQVLRDSLSIKIVSKSSQQILSQLDLRFFLGTKICFCKDKIQE
jgi:hypothetical protein